MCVFNRKKRRRRRNTNSVSQYPTVPHVPEEIQSMRPQQMMPQMMHQPMMIQQRLGPSSMNTLQGPLQQRMYQYNI